MDYILKNNNTQQFLKCTSIILKESQSKNICPNRTHNLQIHYLTNNLYFYFSDIFTTCFLYISSKKVNIFVIKYFSCQETQRSMLKLFNKNNLCRQIYFSITWERKYFCMQIRKKQKNQIVYVILLFLLEIKRKQNNVYFLKGHIQIYKK